MDGIRNMDGIRTRLVWAVNGIEWQYTLIRVGVTVTVTVRTRVWVRVRVRVKWYGLWTG